MKLYLTDLVKLREHFIHIAELHYGTKYVYGGKTILTGLDCSQLVINCLKQIGWLSENVDATAHGLWQMYSKDFPGDIQQPFRGCLAFWFEGDKVVHMGICVDEVMTIQAVGQGPDRYVRYRRVDIDEREVRFVNIFAPEVMLK